MPPYTEIEGGPSANLVESGNLTATGASPWMPLRGQGEHVFTCDVEKIASPSGTFVVEKRLARKDGSFGAEETIYSSAAVADFPQTGRLAGNWDVRVRCSIYGGGTFNLVIAK